MFLVRFIFIVISTSIFAQQTNIEQIPSPKIDNKNLKTLLLNDGTPIYAMYDTSEILPWSKNLYDSHKPALFKLKNNDIIYNYYAIQNTKLCPIGKHVITINDVKLTDNSEKSRLSFYLPSLFLDYSGNCQTSNEITVKKDKIIAVETKTTIKEIDANKFLSVIFSSDGGYTDFKNETSDFLPTRCVEDLTYSLKNNVYSYANLMPQKFDQLTKKLSQEVLFRSENNSLAGSQGIFNLGFNHSGENISTLTANSNFEFWNSVMPVVKNKENLPSPFYESIFPATKDVITVKLIEIDNYANMHKGTKEAFQYKSFFTGPVDEKNFSNLKDSWYKNRYCTNRFGHVTNLDQFFNYTATVSLEPFKYQVFLDNIVQKTPTYFVSKFHLRGSFTPLKSLVFPGLGSKALSFGNIHRTHKALAITSLVLSAISFTVSEVYYQSYLRNINTELHSMNYELANSFHKAGIVSLGIYPLISISDILSCYIKCKSDGIQLAGNKRIQRLVNKEINDNRRKNIYLCRD
jgi:hypothetical protein